MSEEPEVSPLRLKRPGAGGPPSTPPPGMPPSGAPPASSFSKNPVDEPPLMPLPGMPPPPFPSPSPAGDAAAPSPLRRRPSLTSDGGAAPAAPAPSLFLPPETAPSASIPPKEAPPAAPAAGAQPFKLKVGPRSLPPLPPLPPLSHPTDAPHAGSHAQGLPPLDEATGAAPLLPLPGMPPGGMMIGGLPPAPPLAPLPALTPPEPAASVPRGPIHLRAEAPAEALDPQKLPPALPARAAKAAVGRSHARRDALIFGLIFLLVAGAGAGAYFYFAKEDAIQAADTVREKINQAAQLPGKAVDDAKNALAGARDKEQARVDAVSDGKETPSDRAVGNVTPGELSSKLQEKNTGMPGATTTAPATTPNQPVTAYAGEKTPAPAPVPVPVVVPQASARFLRYAEGIRVSGVFQGSPARALVDGRLIREGDLVEPTLGIKFADLDSDAKQLILQDATGAQVRVKY